jgi:RNA polymerase sigma-70 factor (ECF subfamily)
VPGDEELLARVQKKDYEAVGVLFDRYTRLFVGIAYRILRDRGEAEDMVQEIFLRLCQKSNTFDPAKGSARTWMVQFVYRRSFDPKIFLRLYRDRAAEEYSTGSHWSAPALQDLFVLVQNILR